MVRETLLSARMTANAGRNPTMCDAKALQSDVKPESKVVGSKTWMERAHSLRNNKESGEV